MGPANHFVLYPFHSRQVIPAPFGVIPPGLPRTCYNYAHQEPITKLPFVPYTTLISLS